MLYVSAEALNPKGTDKLISTMADALKVLPIAAMHPAQLYVSGSLTLLALGALAVLNAAMLRPAGRGRGTLPPSRRAAAARPAQVTMPGRLVGDAAADGR